jgi:hypothetical protein
MGDIRKGILAILATLAEIKKRFETPLEERDKFFGTFCKDIHECLEQIQEQVLETKALLRHIDETQEDVEEAVGESLDKMLSLGEKMSELCGYISGYFKRDG